ncbi:MAG: NAD(P)H-quinone oxidoreductase [Thermodesulfobacteriota bacterium]|nr:NAD(P)H-quinone oxidoreductase [Thermodesulfobacteriota bacterium]
MRCAVIEKFGKDLNNLVITEREDLKSNGEEVRVNVTATAINRADVLQRRGFYPAPAGVVQDIPGLEFVGHIDQIGESVTQWKGKERVFGILAGGTYASQVVTHQRMVVSVPDELDDIEAAAVPEAFIAAHDALVTQGEMKTGYLVLIHAVAGGVGSAALQLVNLLGGETIGTAGSAEKISKVENLAPFTGVNYKEEDFQKVIEEKFGKSPIDLVVDVIGASYWERNIALLKSRGTLVLLGFMGGMKAQTNLSTVLSNRIRIIGTVLRSRPLEEKILATQAFSKQVVPHFKERRLKPVIDSVFPFDQLHEATARMENKENTGKIILKF